VTALNFRIVQSRQASPQGRTTEERLNEQIAYQEKELGRLRQAALRDPVTGGANMRCLSMAYDWVEDDDPVSVLLVDVDGFHKVNDALGRDCGDAVLLALHNELERCLRWDDIAARESGDRFVALLPLAIKEDAEAVAERLRASVERMVFQSKMGRFKLTVRIGCANRSRGESLNSVLSRADVATRNGECLGGNVVYAS
jgi:diguanylate cyclase (GGDEF)-like protein